MAGDEIPYFGLQRPGETGDRHAAPIGVMGDGGSGPTGVCDDGKPPPTKRRLGGVDPPVCVEILDGVATDDSALFEDPFVEIIRAGQGAGVAQARPGAGG